MTPRRSDRLVVKLVTATVVAGLVTALVGVVLVGASARSALRAEIAQGNAAVAEGLAIRLDARVDSLVRSLRIAATQRSVTALEREAVIDLRAVLTASATFDELVLFDAEGRPVATAAARFLAEPGDHPPRMDVVESVEADGRYLRVLEGFPPVLEIAVPVESPPGNVRGALLGRTPLDLVAGDVPHVNPESDAVRFLVDSEGRILVHPSRDRVARGDRIPLEQVLAQPGTATLDLEGGPWLVAAAPTVLLDGAVVVQQEEAAALAPVAQQLSELAWIVVAVIAMAVVAVSLTGRQLLRPLRPLSAAVDRLARGERGVRVDVPSGGEIGALARQFDRMAEALDRRREEVEQLHHLSLLVTSRALRQHVAEDVVEGARTLFMAAGCAFLTTNDDGGLTVEASAGNGAARAVASEAVARALQEGPAWSDSPDDGEAVIALPVGRGEDGPRGVLAMVRESGPLGDQELRLAETFASFAGVALENVRRLELEQALVHELEEAVDQRRDLIGNVTHDLRVPISSIESFSARLREGWRGMADEQRDEVLSQIEEQAEILDSLVTDLLEFSISERGRRPVTMVPILIRRPVASALEVIAPLLGGRPTETDLPEVEVMADPVLVTRTLIHFLSNAVRSSPAGTPIVVRGRSEEGILRVEVTDEGSGLTAADASRAFQPFWRRSGGDDGDSQPTGLGLALAAEYVRAMGGTVGVEAEPERGSTFYFTLGLVGEIS